VKCNINKFLNISLIIALISLLVLLFLYHLNIPAYYIDKNAAWEFINKNPDATISQLNSQFKNPQYDFQNGLFHILSISGGLFFLCLVIKSKICENMTVRKICFNKFLIYLLWNILYIIFAHFSVITTVIELEKYVYPATADSMGIPEFFISAFYYYAGFIYYPVINILTFIVYNTKFSNKFLVLIYQAFFILLMLDMIMKIFSQFSPHYIILYFVYISYLLLISDSIRYLHNKK